MVLAPLAGWTDTVFRQICKEFGVGLIFTEMASADAIVRNRTRTMEICRFTAAERPIGIQLFGAEAKTLGQAAAIVAAELQPDFIDINFGCPAKKVVKRGGGSALMRDLSLLEAIGRAVVSASPIPVTAKLRAGWNDHVVVEASQQLEAAGVAAVTIHPRTQKMGFKGAADWRLIAAVKQVVTIPVIGNGDITCAADARRMFAETGCDLVMIGRAAQGNPWIFQQTIDLLQDGVEPPPPAAVERLRLCLHHLDLQEQTYGAQSAVFTMRKHIASYLKGLPNAAAVKAQIFRTSDFAQVRRELNDYSNTLAQARISA